MRHTVLSKPRRKGAVVLLVGAVLLGLGASFLGIQAAQDAVYENLASMARSDRVQGAQSGDSVLSAASAKEDSGLDWDALLAQNASLVAWLSVEGTAIDYPVVQPADGQDADYYLHHDFWGAYSTQGCPYLDARASADGMHLLVYGHHLSSSGQMFTALYRAYQQDVFEGIGTATWETQTGAVEFVPVCSLSVDKAYADIQVFSFGSTAELRAWLAGIAEDASARSNGWTELCAQATRVLTLVTCSSTIAGQRARTLVIFAAL